MSFLLRVILPDTPGNLGAVASALGGAGADILSIDVVERSGGQAVDDIAIELSANRPPDVLITAAESVPGVTVESVRPHTGLLDTHRELELLDEIAGNPGHGLDLLTAEVPRLFRAGWALVAVSELGRSYRIAESSTAPETRTGDLPWLPLDRTIALDDSHWVPEPWRAMDTELAAAPFGTGAPPKTLVVGRPGGPVFRPSELARLAHLAGIVATVLKA